MAAYGTSLEAVPFRTEAYFDRLTTNEEIYLFTFVLILSKDAHVAQSSVVLLPLHVPLFRHLVIG
jgi:hypothetical protein